MSTSTRVDLSEFHRRAVARFADQVETLVPEDWTRPTPCVGWNVRDLVNHVVAEDLWTPPLLAGRTVTEIGDAFEGDRLGAVPAMSFREAATQAIAAVVAPGALEGRVQVTSGEIAASEYVWQLTTDHLVHSWDLARAVGHDERLDPELVAACGTWFSDHEETYRAAGHVGPRGQVTDPTPQAQLLAAFGRTP